MNAQDIMTRKVVIVRPDTPVPDIAMLLLDHRISGVPVVDEQGEVVGIVSEGDLLRRVELGTEKRRNRFLEFFTSVSRVAEDYVHARGLKARDVMTQSVISVDPKMPLAEIVDILERRGVKRLPVIENDRLVGIITRANLVRAFVAVHSDRGGRSAEADVVIRALLLRELDRYPWGRRPESGIVVTDGAVHYWGLVDSEAEFRALRVAAEAIPGVKQVVDHTMVVDPSSFMGDGLFVA